MKKLFSSALLVALMLGLPSHSMAKGRRRPDSSVSGEVTAVSEKTITIKEGKRGTIKTLFVPAGVSINGGGRSSSSSGSASSTNGGATPTLSGLVGKQVKVKESTAGKASEITIIEQKEKKKA